ncbi:hypothetical protein KR084_000582 [Drosophila pseudotakahashii]|nr:hypothetical protein KR084_000582 [Drosophila pseudotakahashii]
MAAPSRRYRKCRSKTMSLVAALLLGLTVTLAAGNDAISAPKAAKDLQPKQQRHQQPDIEDDGGARRDKDFDFAAYVNDFNLQEEASIPEDIFDQHDGDIEDEDAQYAPSAAAAAAAEKEDAAAPANDDDDDDVGLMEEDVDDDASEADIILESQRPTSRNFSVYLDAKKYENNKNQKRSKEKKKNNISHYNYKLKNNKENRRPPKESTPPAASAAAAAPAAGKSGMETLVLGGGKSKFTSGDDQDDDDDNANTNANFGRQSFGFGYKKLKNMHEQQSQQEEKEEKEQKEEEDRKRGDDGDLLGEYPTSQLFDAIEILNERKFNKPSAQSTAKKEQEQQKSRQVDEAIGDIEDNLDNDEVLPNQEDEDNDDDIEDIKSPIDNDELAKKYPVAASTTTKVPATLATSKGTSSTTTTTTSTTTTTPRTWPTIGRKLKRNFFGLPQNTETRYYGSYDIGRVRASAVQEEDDNDGDEQDEQDVGQLHYYDTSGNPRKLVTFDPEKSEENYLATEKKQQQQQQQHATRYVDDDYAEEQPPAEKSKLENPWEKSAEKPEEERQKEEQKQEQEQLEDGKLESDLESALQRYHEATGATPTAAAAPSSAFERFKALRRSRQRTGHKSHKKRYKDYLKRHPERIAKMTPEVVTPSSPTISSRHLQKLQKERERSTHSAPIFALGLRPQRPLTLTLTTGKPFYEGQVNYYDHQPQQLDVDLKHHTEMERLIAHDNGNWYRRISPVLRNGIKSDQTAVKEHGHHHHHGHGHGHGHLGNHHHHHHHHHSHSGHGHHGHPKSTHLRSPRPSNPYQRKALPGVLGVPNPPAAPPPPPPTPPLPPPKPQLGHQITELEHLERYYAKWPHLARVQFQVYDEHYRESHPELYGDYEDDYESAAELEEAEQERGEEANLPPYIKKYNRRNKQLLNLLEGTLPTPTQSPGNGNSLGSSTESIRLDDEYLKEKRRRYHQHQRFEDLFAQQKSSTTTVGPRELVTQVVVDAVTSSTPATNQLPEEDAPAAGVSGEEPNDPAPETLDFWQREMASKAGKMVGKMGTPSSSTTTPKPALFKLPSYPAIAGSFLGTPRSRSRSAQFVANVAGRGQSSWPRLEAGNSTEKPEGGGGGGSPSGAGGGRGDPSPLNSFVYHRVIDGIGGGGGASASSGISGSSRGKQSRLPFVAITDRRLEKSLAERHKDFEQNHFPMP